jgi:glucose/arabinose dehydrogenase
MEVFARGVGNSMGLDWNPATNELWFTDNGRDGMGDDVPPDELNFPPQSRMNFGLPYCHGGNIPDPVFGQKHPCTEFVAPAMGLPAHVASLGMCFYEGNMFPTAYKNQVFIAEMVRGIEVFRPGTTSDWSMWRGITPATTRCSPKAG